MVHFQPLISALCKEGVDFVVIGGLAAVAQGSAYLTGDLDVCYSRTDTNLERLSKALEPLHVRLRGAPPDLPFVLDAKTLRAGCNFTLTTDEGDLDILGEVTGLGGYSQVSEYSELLEIEGFPCRVLSIEGLILAKKAIGRSKDLAHVAELEALLALRKNWDKK